MHNDSPIQTLAVRGSRTFLPQAALFSQPPKSAGKVHPRHPPVFEKHYLQQEKQMKAFPSIRFSLDYRIRLINTNYKQSGYNPQLSQLTANSATSPRFTRQSPFRSYFESGRAEVTQTDSPVTA
jgi:hypothetical protein